MVLQIEMTDNELALIKQATNQTDAAAAVAAAAREFVRISQLKQLKSVSGKVDFGLDWRGLESLEMGELPG
jgi:hypothetical protein